MDSVQQQLASLPADKRQQTINDLRRQIGYSEEAVRQEHFGFSAPTIEREEEEGFFRFERGRRHGLN
ncbi:hypothetical protein [uncultured Marinobacter sp.]|uniref:hypothetical protein n=1 Tax=uncultured Marinobacter sp. TaxID=187379 RepID=UPI002582EF54|nr:hypothetical protein [uncultured Marinobacter sp.]